MKILHVANFSLRKYGQQFYAMDRKITHGLIGLGHFVYEFSSRDVARMESPLRIKKLGIGTMNRALLDAIDALQPDLLLLGHSELVSPETLTEVRRRHPRLPQAMWYVDAFTPAKRANVGAKLPFLDALFATTAGDTLASLREFGDATLAYLPNLCLAAVDTGRAFALERPAHDLCYIGAATPERIAMREGISRALPALRTAFRGHDRANKLLGQDYIDLISQSAMGLNYSRYHDMRLYSSDRLIHLLANGAMVLTAAIPGLDTLFSDGELVVFGDDADLHAKLRHYLAHDDERRRIAAAGHRRAHASYNVVRGGRFMLETLSGHYTEHYEWQAEIYRKAGA